MSEMQFVGEGDEEYAYVHFRYSTTGSKAAHEVVWVYRK